MELTLNKLTECTFKKRPPSIAIEINPANATTKKRGIIIRSGSELEQIKELVSNPKVVELAKSIDHVNPENKGNTTRSSDTDIIEI